ncbi:hypothetical protein GALL_36460 [mine drainage metagenome]|uniref:Uncharacterized protein n=1 Tax=mine drainage metagenome TaxID=410659 RepID=A0A1J5TNQ9_9ZZZZ
MSCSYSTTMWLPAIRKKILYLDQFFFSSAFRERDPRFVEAAARIREISALQLLAVPFSSIHEDETHQWRGYDGKNKEDLMEFIKATSRGHEFEPSYDVEQTQIVRAFKAFLQGSPPAFELDERDSVPSDIHEWDDYFRIDVGRYINDIDLMRDLKRQGVEMLVDTFAAWRQSTNSYEQDVAIELQEAARNYLNSYAKYAARIAAGDYAALLDSPIMAMVVQTLLHCLPNDSQPKESLRKIGAFFQSEHFSEIPYQWLSVRIFATLKDMVKHGAFANREAALQRLSGFFQDTQHVAIYAPYCDAFVMDQAMAALVADPRIALETRYGVKVFSLNNWGDFLAWLSALEAGMSQEHRTGLAAAYP